MTVFSIKKKCVRVYYLYFVLLGLRRLVLFVNSYQHLQPLICLAILCQVISSLCHS